MNNQEPTKLLSFIYLFKAQTKISKHFVPFKNG
uniref:Uncharacterized protein n=1 Tax=Arundo donax TaxID=35708 RepID=A0A0A9AER0_ARUDO